METAIAMLTRPNAASAVVKATARFTRTEPAAIPGQTRGPHSRTAASAMPDGGHTAVAYPGGIASESPTIPVRV